MIARMAVAGRSSLLVPLILSGCMMAPPGDDDALPNGGQGGTLTPAELDGAWRFVPDSDAIPAECYEFDAGTVVFYSSFCDDVTDLEEPVAAQIDGQSFLLVFQASLFPSGATVRLEGSVVDENTIRVEMTLMELGGSQELSAPGRLVRGE